MAHPPSSEREPSSRSSSSAGAPGLKFQFLTLFPEIFPPVLQSSLMGKARERGLVSFETIQIRDFTTDRHRTADDSPYGGGEGMVMKADVLHSAWRVARANGGEKSRTIFVSPQGRLLDQKLARELSREESLIVVCGHYEGVDERFIERCVDDEISIGDYVLTGGELPALVLADAVTRLLPGVVGNERSISEESLENGLLKYPQYTKPREFEGLTVPEVLLSGDHGQIARWREAQAVERTKRKRPDLWAKRPSPVKT
ncbi:MAG TPA: tRNA (guanosine(37)-N1)-methyltransferase TrmD [Bdellovibrionota bacterium]|nr:tRNA (guanosine(37)-N1)-methyltransferase TrmD [Bdellovibrionota bacterium]